MAEFNLGRLRFVWKGEWVTGTSYLRDDVVRYGGSSYVCRGGHTAQSNFYADRDLGSWEIMAGGFEWESEWQGNTYYKIGNVVRYGVTIYLCIVGHTSDATTFENDGANWEILVAGLNWRDTWGLAIQYQTNELVVQSDRLYIALRDNIGADPDTSALDWRRLTGSLGLQDGDAIGVDLIPNTDVAYDLGSATNKWRDLYLSGSTIYLGTTQLSVTLDGKISALGGFDLGGTESLENGEINITGNVISTINSNSDLDLRTSGTGAINLEANTNIIGNLDVSGDITLGGNIRIGDQDVDTVEVQADFISNIVPDAPDTYDLGSSAKQWANVYTNNIRVNNAITTTDTGTIDVLNTNATVINAFGAASTITIGDINGETTLRTTLVVNGALELDNQLAVQYGGTGLTSITEKGIIYGNGTNAVGVVAESDPGVSNASTSFAILTTDSNNVPVWTDVVDEGTF
jgi:hypothetical protein